MRFAITILSWTLVLAALAEAFTVPSSTSTVGGSKTHPLSFQRDSFAEVQDRIDARSIFCQRSVNQQQSLTVMEAQKKRRRKRKVQPGGEAPTASTAASSTSSPSTSASAPASVEAATAVDADAKKDLRAELEASASLDAFDLGADGFVENDDEASSLPLPDIREARSRRKEREEEEEEKKRQEEFKPKINRKDIEAMKKLLEAEPFADADDTFFEEEEYGTVSALLGEKAKPFLGIGSGPLQVGHFIGALAIILMAFVEYPGFPLTNLPTPLRDCFQGGLATVYAVNVVLAIFATFKAGERGQSALLWGIKTVAVGGLAYDQLSQLPTTAEIERRKSVKGKRALKKR